MSTKNVTLHDENGNILLPATKTSRVTDANGTNLDTLLQQAGQVKSISVNGVTQTIDANGNVNIASADGVGIASVVQTTTSTEDGGTNVVTVTKTDNTTSTFSVKNGSKGSKGDQGIQGERGLPGESGVTGDVSGFTVRQTIDPSTTYAATDIAGAASLQATNAELTELAGNVDGLMTEVGGTGMQINLASYPNVMFTINTSGVWATTSNANHSIFVPMQDGEYKLTASTLTPALYTVLTSNATPTAGATPAYATGYTNRITIPAGGTVTVQGTSGLYLWMRNDTSTSGAMPPTVMYSSGASRIDDIEERMDALEQDMLVETDIPISSIPSYSGYAIYQGKWFAKSSWKYLLLEVNEGDVVEFQGNAGYATSYAFLHTNNAASNVVPDYAPDTTIHALALGEVKKVVIPSGASYLYLTKMLNYDAAPQYVKASVTIKDTVNAINSEFDNIYEEITPFTTKTISLSASAGSIDKALFDFIKGRKYKIKITRTNGTAAVEINAYAAPINNTIYNNIALLGEGVSDIEVEWTATSYKYIGIASSGSVGVNIGIKWDFEDIDDRLKACEMSQRITDANFFNVEEEGLFFVDKNLNVGAKIDSSGFHAININD